MWLRLVLLGVWCLPLIALEQRLTGSQVLVGKHFALESDAETEVAQAALDHLERFHAHLTAVFAEVAAPADGREIVRYCRDRASFLAYGRAHCPGFSDGWYGYQAAPTATAPAELVLMHLGTNRSVLQHEAFHLFMARTFPDIRTWPRWFDEGLADWIARGRFVEGRFRLPERLDPADVARVQNALKDGSLVPLARLMTLDNAGWNGPGQLLHYSEGYLLAAWLMQAEERPWNGLLRSFLLELVRTRRYEPAFQGTVAKAGIERMQQEWLGWLRAQR